MKTKLFFTALIFSFVFNSYSQTSTTKTVKAENHSADSVDWEKPINFFAAAGASYMIGSHYSVVVSPVDNTIQFEKTYPIMTRFSLGLVWNPFPKKEEGYVDKFFENKKLNQAYESARRHLAVALLINVFQLSFSSSEFNFTSPIDVGFGLGYRNENFLILGTIELTPLRTPRQYFSDQYKDKNKTLVLAGATEPVRTISIDDNSIFVNRIYPSIGIKIAYSFSKKK
jgi:hypothetical protein